MAESAPLSKVYQENRERSPGKAGAATWIVLGPIEVSANCIDDVDISRAAEVRRSEVASKSVLIPLKVFYMSDFHLHLFRKRHWS